MTALKDSVVLVTGGNRGLGAALVQAAFDAGAAKVYATARDPRAVRNERAVALPLEVTDPASVAALAELAPDVTVVINNAGITHRQGFLDGDLGLIREEFETNLYGPLLVTRTLAPVVERNGGGHILNVASVLSWIAIGGVYSANKAALWSMSNSLRLELLPRGVRVTTLHVGYMDTDMTAGVTDPKSDPADIAQQAIAGIEKNDYEVLADDVTRQVKAGLSSDPSALYPQLAS